MRRLPVAFLLLLAACASTPEPAPPPPPVPTHVSSIALLGRARPEPATTAPLVSAVAGDAIIIGGERVTVGAPVVTWRDPGGYDAYLQRCFFSSALLPRTPAPGCNTVERFSGRHVAPDVAAVVSKTGWTRALAAKVIDTVVVHYDVAWTSRTCFKVLHDIRGLSCHFLLDVDGTIYQTLDLVERARHAGTANERSVGIEIAHPGPLELTAGLTARYRKDAKGAIFDLGAKHDEVRTPGFVVRPSRPEPVAGKLHGHAYSMYDYTDEQYASLAKLLAALAKALPDLVLEAPRGDDGKVLPAVAPRIGPGIVGHFHVTKEKQDPGPSFDWERVLAEARRLAGR